MAREQSPPRRTRLLRGEARPRILAAARDLFATRGYSATTTTAIAEKADLSETLVFYHFASKSQLFVESVFEPLRDALTQVIAEREVLTIIDRDEIESRVRHWVSLMHDRLSDNRDLLMAFFSVAAFDQSVLSDAQVGATVASTFSAASAVIEEEFARMHVSAADVALTLRLGAISVAGAVFLLPSTYSADARRPTRAQVVDQVVAMIMGSLDQQRGRTAKPLT